MSNLLKDNKNLMEEYNFKKNENLGINLASITNGNSHLSVWWICKKCGHEWKTAPYNRTKSNPTNCPKCGVKKMLESRNHNLISKKKTLNDYFKENELIKAEWDYEQNTISPCDVLYATNKRAWWICSDCGYSWNAVISSRTVNNNGCPNCRGKKVAITHNTTSIKKYGSLAETHPEIAKEWDYEKNRDLNPNNVHKWSSKKVWWKCSKCNNEWQAVINYRTISGTGCPKCNCEMQTSFPEQAIYYYLSSLFGNEDVLNRFLFMDKCEIDIYLKNENIGIEYDGYFYHSGTKNEEKEKKKNLFLKESGIKLIRIKENLAYDLFNDNLEKDIIGICKNPNFKDYNDMLQKLISRLNKLCKKNFVINISTESDRITIMNNYINKFKERSLLSVNPELCKEWNYEKNGELMPDMVTSKSRKKVWWICEKGHEWEYNIADRGIGDGCPYCSNHKVLKGYNDLATTNPKLVKEWDYEKNDIKPDMVTISSSKKIYWKCVNGHSWYISPNGRSKGSGCPYCSNHKVLKGYNDLATTNPELIKEWDYEKNDIKPDELVSGNKNKYWWKCIKCGYNWKTSIYSRKSGHGCPKCGNIEAQKKTNLNKLKITDSLFEKYPELCNEWNYEKNEINPKYVLPQSNKKVWWICEKGHEWEASICKRTSGRNCPYCSNKKVLVGYNDFKSKYPKLIEEWNYEKNTIKPNELVYGSYKKVWWRCSTCGHEWETILASRTIYNCGCPICKRKRK